MDSAPVWPGCDGEKRTQVLMPLILHVLSPDARVRFHLRKKKRKNGFSMSSSTKSLVQAERFRGTPAACRTHP